MNDPAGIDPCTVSQTPGPDVKDPAIEAEPQSLRKGDIIEKPNHDCERCQLVAEIVRLKKVVLYAKNRLETYGGHNDPDPSGAYTILMDEIIAWEVSDE